MGFRTPSHPGLPARCGILTEKQIPVRETREAGARKGQKRPLGGPGQRVQVNDLGGAGPQTL